MFSKDHVAEFKSSLTGNLDQNQNGRQQLFHWISLCLLSNRWQGRPPWHFWTACKQCTIPKTIKWWPLFQCMEKICFSVDMIDTATPLLELNIREGLWCIIQWTLFGSKANTKEDHNSPSIGNSLHIAQPASTRAACQANVGCIQAAVRNA